MALDNQVIYELLLKDGFSPGIQKADEHVQIFEKHLSGVKSTALGMLEGLGVAFAGFKIAEFINSSREETEKLHQAEAQLSNTMQNMGTYSEEAFEKSIKGAYDLSQQVQFSEKDIIGLQSQLRLVGTIGEDEMQRLTFASTDFATKFGLSLTEAGELLAKAVNSPDFARRLEQRLKLDPAVMQQVQLLAKHGKEAEARMLLLAAAEEKVGGAAAAAFAADPMAQFNKSLYDAKIIVGQLALDLLKTLMPVMLAAVRAIKDVVTWIKEHKEVLGELAIGLGVAATAVGAYSLIVNAAAIAEAVVTGATWLWNVALNANPLFAVITMIGLFVAAIIDAYKHIETFRAVLFGVWAVIKWFVSTVVDLFGGLWHVVHGVFTIDPVEATQGFQQTAKAMADLSYNAGKNISDQYHKGFAEGQADFRADQNKSLIPTTKPGKASVADGLPPIQAPKTKATGSRNITINVSIKDLIGNYNSNVTNVKENAKALRDIVIETLTGAVNDFQVVAEH